MPRKRRYTYRTPEERVQFHEAKLAKKEAYYERQINKLVPLREKILKMREALAPVQTPEPVAPEVPVNG